VIGSVARAATIVVGTVATVSVSAAHHAEVTVVVVTANVSVARRVAMTVTVAAAIVTANASAMVATVVGLAAAHGPHAVAKNAAAGATRLLTASVLRVLLLKLVTEPAHLRVRNLPA